MTPVERHYHNALYWAKEARIVYAHSQKQQWKFDEVLRRAKEALQAEKVERALQTMVDNEIAKRERFALTGTGDCGTLKL